MIPVIYKKNEYLTTLKYVISKTDGQIIDSNMGGHSINEFNKQFLANRQIKPDLKSLCTHLILSITSNSDNHEHLNDEQWTTVARRCLQELGYLPNNDEKAPH